MINASSFLTGGFIALAIAITAGWLLALRRATSVSDPVTKRKGNVIGALIVAFVIATGFAASRGVLDFGAMPPRMFVLLVVTIVLTVLLVRSKHGQLIATQLPLALLVASQCFRLPLELLMHRAYDEGLMPVQMSYSGYNFDILTGTTALIVAALVYKGVAGRKLVLLWNIVGMVLLLTIVTIALLSTPTPLRVFDKEPANTWITAFPFAWLPLVMVPTALAGHLLIFRRLKAPASLD